MFGKILCFALLLILCFGYLAYNLQTKSLKTVSVQGNLAEIQNKIDFETERYAVFSALLNNVEFKRKWDLEVESTNTHIFRKKTISCGSNKNSEPLQPKLEEAAALALNVNFDLFNDYRVRSENCTELSGKLDVPFKYIWVTDADLQQKSSSVINFSNVGFSRDEKQAFLYVTRYCGGKCGAGYYVLLNKVNDVWKVKAEKNVWVS